MTDDPRLAKIIQEMEDAEAETERQRELRLRSKAEREARERYDRVIGQRAEPEHGLDPHTASSPRRSAEPSRSTSRS